MAEQSSGQDGLSQDEILRQMREEREDDQSWVPRGGNVPPSRANRQPSGRRRKPQPRRTQAQLRAEAAAMAPHIPDQVTPDTLAPRTLDPEIRRANEVARLMVDQAGEPPEPPTVEPPTPPTEEELRAPF